MTRRARSYVHGTGAEEQRRLAELNRLTNAAFIEFLGVDRGARVLEAGSGLGLLAAGVAAAAPGVDVVGVEYSAVQLAAAVPNPRVRYIRADVHDLPFPEATFDLAYARYVLEHVQDPERVLRELGRVLRPGGHVALCENDVTLVRLDPPCPAFERVWLAFQRHQASLGGDSLIGRRLYRLLRTAGFGSIALSVQPEVHWHGSSAFAPWVLNLAGNVESARAGLIASGLATAREVDEAVGQLHALVDTDTASAHFVWNRARATR